MLGDEELLPSAQAATLEILHSTVMKDPDGPTFEARLRVLAPASAADGKALGAASQVAQVLLDAWTQAQAEDERGETRGRKGRHPAAHPTVPLDARSAAHRRHHAEPAAPGH